MQKASDLDLHCLFRQGVSGFTRIKAFLKHKKSGTQEVPKLHNIFSGSIPEFKIHFYHDFQQYFNFSL